METIMTTDLNIIHHTFKWKISGFEDICPETCTEFNRQKSEIFTVTFDGIETKWYVSMEGKSEFIKFRLHFESATNVDGTNYAEPVFCQFSLSIVDEENEEIIVLQACDRKFKPGSDDQFKKFRTISQLYKERETLLQDGSLQILVKMRVRGKSFTSMTVNPLTKSRKTVNTLETLSTNFGHIFNNKQNSDVEILCGDETFYAHKVVLAARSTVFFAMFKSDMEEGKSSKIVVTDIDACIFRVILWYIYTGKVDMNDTNLYMDLIYGAEKYDLSELKDHCFDHMCCGVTIETIGSLAVAADTYNADDKIKEFIKKFFLRNIDEAIKDPEIKSLLISNPKAFF